MMMSWFQWRLVVGVDSEPKKVVWGRALVDAPQEAGSGTATETSASTSTSPPPTETADVKTAAPEQVEAPVAKEVMPPPAKPAPGK